jgi:hypothetical protein
LGPHADGDYVGVPDPPPAAMPEIIPPQPQPHAVWVDGQWLWRGRYWVWDKGAWVEPAPDSVFHPWDTRYRADGTLEFARARWTDRNGRELPEPRVLREAATPPSEKTAERAAP